MAAVYYSKNFLQKHKLTMWMSNLSKFLVFFHPFCYIFLVIFNKISLCLAQSGTLELCRRWALPALESWHKSPRVTFSQAKAYAFHCSSKNLISITFFTKFLSLHIEVLIFLLIPGKNFSAEDPSKNQSFEFYISMKINTSRVFYDFLT